MKEKIAYQILIKPESNELPIEGPASLIISVTNSGKDAVTILGNKDDFFKIGFQEPDGWMAIEKNELQELQGVLPEFTLLPGQEISNAIYLHDSFSELESGSVALPVTISFWEKQNSVNKEVTHTDTCYFEIKKHSKKEFDNRIDKIRTEILSEKKPERKLKLYQSLTNIQHPELVEIFLEALLNDNMLVFHHTARKQLIDLTEKYDSREDLINHLQKYGSRYDSQFFQLWKNRGIVLSDHQIEKLSQSSSLWIRVFCLENYPGPYNRKGVMESMKTELKELQEKVQKLK